MEELAYLADCNGIINFDSPLNRSLPRSSQMQRYHPLLPLSDRQGNWMKHFFFFAVDGFSCNIYGALTMWQAPFCLLELHTYIPRLGLINAILQMKRLLLQNRGSERRRKSIEITQLESTRDLSNHYGVRLKLI